MALAVSPPNVYLGGVFTSVGGVTRNRIAAVSLASGTPTTWNPNANASVLDIGVSTSTLFAAGTFSTIGGQSRTGVAEISLTSGAATSWNANVTDNDDVEAIALDGNVLYVAGDFEEIGGRSLNTFAAVDASTGAAHPWNLRLDPAVEPPTAGTEGRAMLVNGERVYIGGIFPSVVGEPHRGVAAVSGVGVPVDAPEALAAGTGGLRLSAPRPNPVRDASRVSFEIPREGMVRLSVHDVAGRVVRTFLPGVRLAPGSHEATLDAHDLAAGIYFVRLECDGEVAGEKLIVAP
jgi:hypothetical protein